MRHGTNVEQYQCVARKFQGTGPEPLRTNMYQVENVMMIFTDFQTKLKQPEFHARKLIVVQTPVHPPSSKQQRNDEYIHMTQIKHPQWKTLPHDYHHHFVASLCQV